MANEEEIGFYKGAIYTLTKEREELMKMINIVDQLIKSHLASLQKLGIDLTKELNQQNKQENTDKQNNQ